MEVVIGSRMRRLKWCWRGLREGGLGEERLRKGGLRICRG